MRPSDAVQLREPPQVIAQPRPTLTARDATAIIVGIVIGAGIFRAPSIVAANVASESVFIGLWIAGGALSLVGALCYAELGSAYPNAGGEYYFLKRAYGDRLAFVFAWARMSVVQTGAIAAIAFVFGDYATKLLVLGTHSASIYALLVVAGVTALNVAGTRESKLLQNSLTVMLAVAIVVVIVTGFTMAGEAPERVVEQGSGPPFTQLALIFILLTYGGWNEAAYLTAEMENTRRNIVLSLVSGLGVVTVLYVLLNMAYLRVLGLDGMQASHAVAADLMEATVGGAGAIVLSVIVIAAALSTLNATVLTGARTNYALGRDFHLFRALGVWRERTNSPAPALIAQGAVAMVLVLLGSYTPDGFQTMVAYTAPAFWMFFFLTGASLFVLRRREPVERQHFRVPLYPVLPLVFCGMCAFMLYASTSYALSQNPGSLGAQLGIGVLLAGIPLAYFAKPRA